MKTNETYEMTVVKANVFERMAGAMWRWCSIYRQSVARSVRQHIARYTSLCEQNYEVLR